MINRNSLGEEILSGDETIPVTSRDFKQNPLSHLWFRPTFRGWKDPLVITCVIFVSGFLLTAALS